MYLYICTKMFHLGIKVREAETVNYLKIATVSFSEQWQTIVVHVTHQFYFYTLYSLSILSLEPTVNFGNQCNLQISSPKVNC